MPRSPQPASEAWKATARVLPAPTLLTLGHLVGGAGGLLEATVLTTAIALIGAEAFARGRLELSREYRRGLRVPAVALLLLLLLGLASVTPGSDRLGSGWISERAGLPTLSVDPEATWVELVKILGLSIMFVMAYRYASTEDRMTRTLRGLVWLTAGWALWALVLYALSARAGDGIARLSGTFISPNVAACVLSVGLLCWMGLVDRRPKTRQGRPVAEGLELVASGVILSGTLLMTASRSAILIMAVLAMVWWIGRAWRRTSQGSAPRTRRLLAVSGLAAVAVLAYSADGFLKRISEVGEEAAKREAIFATYFEAASASPVFGHGLGTVPRISRLLLTPANDAVMWNIRAAHNLPLQWWIETGLIGVAIAIVGGGWLLMISGLRLSPTARVSMLPLLMVSAFMLVQGLVDYPAQIYSVALVWSFILGLVYRAATSWAAHRESTHGPQRQRCRDASPRPEKHDNQQASRRLVLSSRAGRVDRH